MPFVPDDAVLMDLGSGPSMMSMLVPPSLSQLATSTPATLYDSDTIMGPKTRGATADMGSPDAPVQRKAIYM